MLKRDLAPGQGDANTLAKFYFRQSSGAGAAGAPASDSDPLIEIYAGPKDELRPIHDKLIAEIHIIDPFEISPKNKYLSLRRKKHFARFGLGTQGRVEVGLNVKGVPGSARLVEQPAGGMCQYKVFVSDAKDVDKELIGWIRQAYDCAGQFNEPGRRSDQHRRLAGVDRLEWLPGATAETLGTLPVAHLYTLGAWLRPWPFMVAGRLLLP
jgi:hypothetical protein